MSGTLWNWASTLLALLARRKRGWDVATDYRSAILDLPWWSNPRICRSYWRSVCSWSEKLYVGHLGHLRTFGCQLWVHMPKEKHKKLDNRSYEGIYIDYEGSNQYQVYNPESGRCHKRCTFSWRYDDSGPDEPLCLKEPMASAYWKEFEKAMHVEFQSIFENGTWGYRNAPSGRIVLD